MSPVASTRDGAPPAERDLPIGRGLLLAFAALVLFVSASTLGVELWHTQRVVDDLSRQITAETHAAAERRLADLFSPVERALLLDHGLVTRGLVERYQPESLVRLLLPGLEQLPQSGSMMVSDASGYQFLIMRYGQLALSSPLIADHRAALPAPVPGVLQFFTRDFRPNSWGARSRWTVLAPDAASVLARFELELPGYDPKARPWHVAALAAFRQRTPAELLTVGAAAVAWTDIYALFTSKTPGISASIAARDPDGELVVVAYDVLLDDISAFTRSHRPTPHGQVFVFTDDGRVVGLPADPRFADPSARATSELRPIAELGVPGMAAAAAAWSRGQGDDERGPFRLEASEGPMWASFRRFPLGTGRGFWTGVLLPESDLEHRVGGSERSVAILALAGLALAAALSGAMSRGFSRPLKALAERSKRIAALDLSPKAPVTSRILEVNELSASLETMREALAADAQQRAAAAEQLRNAQQMAALGRLAGGIAHDYNNLLTVIIGYAHTLRSSLEPGDPRASDVDVILETSTRAADMTHQLLALSPRQIKQPRLLGLGRELPSLARTLARLLGEDVKLDLRVAPDIWPVRVDPGQLQQLIVNLGVNARDAMPEGGTITCTADNLPAEDAVEIRMADTGAGIPPELRERIFEPFFTTKAVGKGIGLGLATCRAIVDGAGGAIGVDSEPGVGTTIRVRLPRARPGLEGDTAPPPTAILEQPATLLVVEDEPAVRALLERILVHAGYQVLVANDGIDALARLDAAAQPVDLLVTDVLMPRMGGAELALRLRERAPDVGLLLLSGYADRPGVPGLVNEGAGFLAKPFEPAALLRAVHEQLERRRRPGHETRVAG
jgi:signal transduction histidine kinase/ActR/RegA family two-component response regulator